MQLDGLALSTFNGSNAWFCETTYLHAEDTFSDGTSVSCIEDVVQLGAITDLMRSGARHYNDSKWPEAGSPRG